MQRAVVLALALATAALVSSVEALAQCPFDVPAKAAGIKVSFVRAYDVCPGQTYPMPNASTAAGVDACSPPVPFPVLGTTTQYSFGPKGACSLSIKAKALGDCSVLEDEDGGSLGLPPSACHVEYLNSKCSDIRDAADEPIDADDAGFALAMLLRWTTQDPNGAMTWIDFPVAFSYSEPKSGSMQIKTTLQATLRDILGPTGAALAPCTTTELLALVIRDNEYTQFAKIGYSTGSN